MAGLAGEGLPAATTADAIFEVAKDILDHKAGLHTADPQLALYLTGAEKLLAAGGGEYTGGKGAALTFGDVALWHALRTVEEIKPGYLAEHGLPALAAFEARVRALPALAAYLASERSLPLTLNETGRAPWTATGYAFLTPINPLALAVVAKDY